MLDVINAILRFLQDYPDIFFAVLGYFNGYLFRDIHVLKIIAIIVVVPYCVDMLIGINWVLTATLPFLLGAVLGYWGIDQSQYRVMAAINFGRNLIGRSWWVAMNKTELIFTGIVAFALGYGLGYFAKHIGDLARRWGIFTVFLFPIIFIVLLSGAEAICQRNNVLLSLIFAAGFVIKMVRR